MPKQREMRGVSASKDIEYSYINYNLEDAKKKLDELSAELDTIKENLNLVNSTLTINIPDMD
jgi:5-bromo-4-chloroindolyl phosphate hydrolysis protein